MTRETKTVINWVLTVSTLLGLIVALCTAGAGYQQLKDSDKAQDLKASECCRRVERLEAGISEKLDFIIKNINQRGPIR